MKIMGMGLDFAGAALFKPIDEEAFAKILLSSLESNAEKLRGLTKTTSQAISFKGEIRRATRDPGDPRMAGWTFLLNSADPQRHEIEEILKPLAVHRGMADPAAPLLYNGESSDEWFAWLNDNYYALQLEGKPVPLYVLIVGGADKVPFRFQSILDTVASVGRLDFDTLDDLRLYIGKVIRLEKAKEPVVTKEVLLFAPDAGPSDPTHFTSEYMVKPLAERIQQELGFTAHTIQGQDATKKRLVNELRTKKPALVYTASHGLIASGEPLEIHKRYNGSICCQCAGPLTIDALFSAEDVPFEQPFLEGAVFFQFACFGYGTPAESDFAHWFPPEATPLRYPGVDFVAALPKRLLAHPRGPIAFIGHLDTAFLHGFADTEALDAIDRWHSRIAPFVDAVDQLLGVQPSGLAMEKMNHRYSICNAWITDTYDRQKRGTLKWTERKVTEFLDNWIVRGDAQNYMVFGDPAARLRIPSEL